MGSALPFTLTNESVTVVSGGKSFVVQKGTANFADLKKALIAEDWDAVPRLLTINGAVAEWAKKWKNGDFIFKEDKFFYKNEALPNNLSARAVTMAAEGKDPGPLLKFWERLQNNPSMRSVEQLWEFLLHQGIPLTKDGYFLAYKGVKNDFTDQHTGTWNNAPGSVNQMPRNKISDDPREACHEGFHVGALGYARTFGPKTVICKVDPADVVCVPYDAEQQKMRVCRYKVIGIHNGGELPSSVYEPDEFDPEVRMKKPAETPEASAPLKEGHKRRTSKGFAKFDKFGMDGLLGLSMDTLRKYAGKGLGILGASKLPGGKVALVSEILKVRK